MPDKPELIELLLINSKKFEKKFQKLLDRVPNIHSTNKAEFFTHFFLGSVLTLPYTELIEKIGIKNIYLKPIISPGEELKTIELCFDMKGKELVFITVTTVKSITDSQHYSNNELKEIAEKTRIQCNRGKIFYIHPAKDLKVKESESKKTKKRTGKKVNHLS